MKTRKLLDERPDVFVFEHSPSLVNYGGAARFYQAAFPPPPEGGRGFEALLFEAIQEFVSLLHAHNGKNESEFEHAPPEWVDIFLDQWCETPHLSFQHFLGWTRKELAAVGEAYRKLRINAIIQERAANLPRLNYLVSLAVVHVCAEVVSDYFEKTVDQLGPLAATARLTLGRCLSVLFRTLESGEELRRLRIEKLGAPEPDPGCQRLLNPFLFGFIDAADYGIVEECLLGPNPYHVSHTLRTRLTQTAGQAVVKSRHLEAKHLKSALAEPKTFYYLLEEPGIRRTLLRLLRRQREIRQQMVLDNARQRVREELRECLRSSPGGREVLPFLANDRVLGELLLKPAHRSRLLKSLRCTKKNRLDELRTVLMRQSLLVKRSRRRWLGGLTRNEMAVELEETFHRLGEYLSQAEDFRLARSHYGRDSNRALPNQGLKIWRCLEVSVSPGAPQPISMPVWPQRQADIQNHFVEGNLFLCRPEGEVYPHLAQRRDRVVFLFADLRNSTETTMRLTKDTASYLAPYLTAVNTAARGFQGTRIYFAGDGFAAYFVEAVDSIRSAYQIGAKFLRLRSASRDSHLRKAKEILDQVAPWKSSLLIPAKVKALLPEIEQTNLPPEGREFLQEISEITSEMISDATLRNLLGKVATLYSMPQIDAGIALTCGDLFFALVGEENEDKTQIVISPHLTQAARLSGSSDLVKKHLEEKITPPWPFQVYAWDSKLYNRGIVLTQDLFKQLKTEVEVKRVAVGDAEFSGEMLYYYLDAKLKRRIILRELNEPVLLKGIDEPCRIYEVALPGSLLDKRLGEM